jgi:phage gp46-like protein
MTDGKEPDKACGYLPGAQGGHWSESYIATEATVGTLVRALPTTGTIAESVATVAAYAEATLYRLVARGVASSVEVVASYAGNMRVAVNVIVYGTNGEVSARVGLSSTRLANGWVWQ